MAALAGVQVCAVAAGCDHSLVLSNKGLVYSFGDGEFGRLGHSDHQNQLTPKVIEGLRGVQVHAISAGVFTSLAVSVSGAVYGWGDGRDLGLGLADGETQCTPLRYSEVRGLAPST